MFMNFANIGLLLFNYGKTGWWNREVLSMNNYLFEGKKTLYEKWKSTIMRLLHSFWKGFAKLRQSYICTRHAEKLGTRNSWSSYIIVENTTCFLSIFTHETSFLHMCNYFLSKANKLLPYMSLALFISTPFKTSMAILERKE